MPVGDNLSIKSLVCNELHVRDTVTLPPGAISSSLASLTDTTFTSLADGDFFTYNSGSGGFWENTVAIAREVLTSVIVGSTAATSLTSGTNVAIGDNAFSSNITGANHVVIGIDAANALVSGDDCVYVGAFCGSNATATDRNTAVGNGALLYNTIGDDNTALGAFAMQGTTPGDSPVACVAVGFEALHRVGNGNTGVTAIGALALSSASYNASFNTAVGHFAGLSSTTGSENVFIGRYAGRNITTGSNNVIIGTDTNCTSTTADSVVIGHNATSTHTGCVVLGRNAASTANDQLTFKVGGAAELRTQFTTDPTPAISSGAGTAIPANATTYLNITINGTSYWTPLFT